MQSPFRRRTVKEFLLITLMGFVISVAICPECWLNLGDLRLYWKTILLCLLYTYILGYGSSYIICKIEHIYSWLDQPVKKFLLQFIVLFVFSFIVSALLFYVFAYLMFEGEKWLTIGEVMNQAKLPAFISVSIAAFFTGTDFLTNWRKEAVRAERLEKEKVITQYESLRNQVNPHFLFNSLNALSELVYENQEIAVKYIRQLSLVYRYVLDSRNREVATLKEEFEFLDSFIFLQKIRFGENLNFDLEVEESETRFILPLSLQILVENIIKHNVISTEDPLQIRIFEEEDYLVVINQLHKKRNAEDNTGVGLQNIKMRYKYLSEKPVFIDEENDSFVVKIPILEEQP